MLFRRKRTKTLTELGPLNEVPWDDETVKWIARNDHLNVKVTHITKTISLGQSDNISQSSDRTYWEGHGVMTYPKFIPVTILAIASFPQRHGCNLIDDAVAHQARVRRH